MSLFIVQAPGSEAGALAKAVFVKDGFAKWAFIFGPLWLLYHRLWALLAIWILAEAAFALLVLPHVPSEVALLVEVLARTLLGLEGNRLRLRTQAPVVDVVAARDLDEAEAIFFRRHLKDGAAAPSAQADDP